MAQRISAGVVALAVSLFASAVYAFPSTLNPSGKLDFTYGARVDSAGGPATNSKPESKLFYTSDGRWWAVLGSGGSFGNNGGIFVYELGGDHAWHARLRLRSGDPWAKADTLLVGQTLYVSLRDDRASTGGGFFVNRRVSILYVLSYQGNGSWSVRSGPTRITTADPEELTIARDSQRRLWVAYEKSHHIQIGSTAPDGTAFSIAPLPVPNVASDDIAAITSFGTDASGRKIGVVWSDQNAQRIWFAWRLDTDAIGDSAWHIETAYGGGVGGCPTATSSACADDHLNVKVLGDDIYLTTKTSLDSDPQTPDPNDPLITLLHRDASGAWSAITAATVAQSLTRPIILLAPAVDRIYLFATKGSGVLAWETSLSAPDFTSSTPVTWTKSSNAGDLNDATSTKQPIQPSIGAVVETSATSTHQYWHNEILPQH